MIRQAAFKSFAIAALAIGLGGCPPPIYGVTREFGIKNIPDNQCVHTVINAIPDIKLVWDNPSSKKVKLYGIPTQIDRSFGYIIQNNKNGNAGFVVTEKPDGSASVSHRYMAFDKQVAQDGATHYQAVMLELEKGLAEECGMTVVPNRLKASCDGCTLPP
jgi:hypothetical protein